ncbi:DUF6988 family protein [Pseudomonas sp. TCU-HL1]|uniref:DUF6988 family protein n=1 Tax=Pseudomonas sp. TCU-HL1 TaxID=1856685 RepID=UPI00083D5044|nr:hypothetical protein [Pseudomonas sp. TCU-HL1]AOE85862.1 hypothetical protein THL1_3314 [Pseudomonas sp. TCU-HL1]
MVLEQFLSRSDELHQSILGLIGDSEIYPGERFLTSFGMCSLSLEHALSIRTLMAIGLQTSAASLLRLQFESLTRGMWLLYGASDAVVEKLTAPLTPDSEQAAKNLPSVDEMIKQMAAKAHPDAIRMLNEFKEISWKALNSFVHCGIHPLHRHVGGFPEQLAMQAVQNSNGLLTMAGMTMAILTGDENCTKPMSKIQHQFKDCLPILIT